MPKSLIPVQIKLRRCCLHSGSGVHQIRPDQAKAHLRAHDKGSNWPVPHTKQEYQVFLEIDLLHIKYPNELLVSLNIAKHVMRRDYR